MSDDPWSKCPSCRKKVPLTPRTHLVMGHGLWLRQADNEKAFFPVCPGVGQETEALK